MNEIFMQFLSLGLILIPVVLILILLILFLFIVAYRIIRQTGYPGASFLLLFIPILNIVFISILAFTRWPAFREANQYHSFLEDLEQRLSDSE